MNVKNLIEVLKGLDQEKEIQTENDFQLCEITEIIESKEIWANTDVYVIN